MTWFEEWSDKRPEIVTEENYSKLEDFMKIAKSFGKAINVRELNPELTEPGQLWDIATLKREGDYYARTSHPNFKQLANRVKELEVGNLSHPEYFSALSCSCGMGAISPVLETIGLGTDGRFIHGDVMYPSTKEILKEKRGNLNMVGSRPAIEAELNDLENLENILKNDQIVGIILEPIANPTLDYTNIRNLAEIAHHHDVPVIVDNTFSPYILEPFRMGADIVIYSQTKYHSGGGDLLGGVVIMPNEFFKDLKETRKHKGYVMSPYDAFRCAQRVKGLGERMEAHCRNASKMAEELEKVEGIKVNYKDLGNETRKGYAGGVLSFVFEGNDEVALERVIRFTEYLCENPGIVKQAVSFAEPKTLVLPWAGQVDKKYLKSNNVPLGLVRIAVGMERDILGVVDYLKKGIKYAL